MSIEISHLMLVSNGRTRLNDVTVRIGPGVTALVGYSGAGKTSLLNVLAGFERPDGGSVKMEQSHAAGRLPVFWVPQSGGLWSHLNVAEHLSAVATSTIFDQLQISADEILGLLDLDHRRQSVPGELSQGECSRLALARALVSGAQVLLLDEPLAHVDPARRSGYWRLMRTVFARLSTTVLFASHEPDAVVRESSRVLCMHAGQLTYSGFTRELYEHPPDRISGEFLGRLNWFESDEISQWSRPGHVGPQENEDAMEMNEDGTQRGVGIRPERLQLVRDSEACVEVIESLFAGAFSETVVRHQQTGLQRTLIHRSPGQDLQPGDSVWMTITQCMD